MPFGQRLVMLLSASLPFSSAVAVEKRQLPPDPLFLKAPHLDKRFQPAVDFDTDSCYNSPAMGPPPTNDLNTGLEPKNSLKSLTDDCRKEEMLERGNVYSRQRCNNGYCAIMYAYYFQKDQTGVAGPAHGHRHDWEHVVVWVRMEDLSNEPATEGHPAVVYHKDAGSTHAFRFADGPDFGNGGPENHWRKWIFGPLIGHFGWDSFEQRERMYTEGGAKNPWGDADLAITDGSFSTNLGKAKPKEINFDIHNDDPQTNNIE
ncbi:necrosis and ethylene-inducing protein-inducing protein [Rhypophila decipiens]|uniref:Necrosis and ethylene-inducing protein-inducing protein n=1 Tax=Rhypophila decipiens TaxID=261697 RepID=A0AAN6XSD4_9PEZI|nr:necrosis and ethylene-inducing protein-inducing protein [Rhypophila decipiens]